MKIALVQLNSQDSVADNLKSIWSHLDAIEDLGSLDLVIFPENALYFRTNRKQIFEGISLDDSLFDAFKKWSDQYDVALIWGGVALNEDGVVSNAMILQEPGFKPNVIYRKIHLFDVTLPDGTEIKESEQFAAGSKPSTWIYKDWKFGLSICYDVRFSELYSGYAAKEVDAILVPSAFTKITGEAHWHQLLRARAIETQSYVLAPGQTGAHGKIQTYGHSLVVDPWGVVQADQSESEGVLICELNKKNIQDVRSKIPMSQHRKL